MERPPEEGNWCLKEPEVWGKGRQGREDNRVMGLSRDRMRTSWAGVEVAGTLEGDNSVEICS